MKILIPAAKEIFLDDKNANPFIALLYDGLRQKGFDVVCDLKEFWDNGQNYDAVFFQWPEVVFRRKKIDQAQFESYLQGLKDKGVKIVATCHNLHAHINDNQANLLYDILYAHADAIHHLGMFSYHLFLHRYPNCHHFVAEHPIFFDITALQLHQNECRKRLSLPMRKKMILAFGAFRNREEKQLFLSLADGQLGSDVIFVAPRLDHELGLVQGWHWERSLVHLYKRVMLKWKGVYCRRGIVERDDVPAYFAAADVVFIQRLDILNSGNVPLAFAASKVVVGPDMGNVGELLKATGNPCFDVSNPADVILKCRDALSLSKEGRIGEANYQYAQRNMLPQHFIDTIADHLSAL